MFMVNQDTLPGANVGQFSMPVESIMMCEDFKSNFARRLSNRYSSRSPTSSPRKPPILQLRTQKTEDTPYVPERIEANTQLSKKTVEQCSDVPKPADEVEVKSDMRCTEVTALTMEVETLRWQMAHTEANRQMHIALLKQIVTFLNKVRDHIETQKNDSPVKDATPPRLPRSFNVADLPRSRSVLHVNKNIEYTNTGKKISTKKISKSISNVNGFKDSASLWNQSKLSLISERESSEKITQEMSRLITLANTVLSTKLPDLTCVCNKSIEKILEKPSFNIGDEIEKTNEVTNLMNHVEENIKDPKKENITFPSDIDLHDGFSTKYVKDLKDTGLKSFIMAQSSIVENDFTCKELELKGQPSPTSIKSDFEQSNGKILKSTKAKRDDYSHVSNFIEDESGFSSMSSFQEIGIPIISIIPPSPCKEVGYIDEISDIFNESEKWKADAIELDKQAVKVFWV